MSRADEDYETGAFPPDSSDDDEDEEEEGASAAPEQQTALARRMLDLNYWRSIYRRLQSQLAERESLLCPAA